MRVLVLSMVVLGFTFGCSPESEQDLRREIDFLKSEVTVAQYQADIAQRKVERLQGAYALCLGEQIR